MPIVDANVILRYLLNDHPDMSPAARAIIEAGAQTTPEVLAEAVYVLKGLYKVSRMDIAAALSSLLEDVQVRDRTAVSYACRLFGARNLDFVDCLLAGYHHVNGTEIATFDKDLCKAIRTDFLSAK